MEIALNQPFRRRRKRKNDNICVIKGSVKGNIVSQGSVIVGDTGYYTGKINAVVVEIAGEFRGSIDAIKLVVHPHGYVHYQKAKYERLVLHEGGVFAPLNGVGAQENQADNIEAAQVPFEEQAHVHVCTEPAPMHKVFAEPEVAVAAEQEDTAEEKETAPPTGQFEPAIITEQPQPAVSQPEEQEIAALKQKDTAEEKETAPPTGQFEPTTTAEQSQNEPTSSDPEQSQPGQPQAEIPAYPRFFNSY
jgi:cytoskeletal protein CcmA (bactofilin family)